MQIIIVGCGKVCYTLVEQLSGEDHNIVVIDEKEERVRAITDELDAMGVIGNGVSYQTLLEAGITKADLFELGLSGGTGSAQKRQDLLCAMQLPAHLSPNALLDVLNCITDLESLQAVVQKLEA